MDWLVLAILVLVFAFISGVAIASTDSTREKVGLWIFGTIAFALVIGALMHDTHKRAQIEAVTTGIDYELVTKPDSTRVWEHK